MNTVLTEPITIAALFVATNGPYFNLVGVEPYDEERDALTYHGPHPVICHPDCARWGRYWSGGPNPRAKRRKLGDDGGHFKFSLNAVRTYGGVLEHPAHTHAWEAFDLDRPFREGGWALCRDGGFVCQVEQGHYGHKARKATWLYAFGVEGHLLPKLKWGPAPSGPRLDLGFHSSAERRAKKHLIAGMEQTRLTVKENIWTPPAFRNVLIGIARSV